MIGLFPMVWAHLATTTRTRTKGEWVDTMTAAGDILIIEPQPADENDLRMLEPGERLANWRITWTSAAVNPTDEITYNLIPYKVHQVNDRVEFRRVMMREKVSNVA